MVGIKLVNVCKSFCVDGNKFSVLKGINLDIPQNKTTVILGKSGCGKTTILRIVGGLESVDEGKVIFNKDYKRAFVFQEARLMPWLNVWNNVIFGLKNEEIDNNKIQRIVNMASLSGFEHAYPYQLSGGMKQRTSIARAFAYNPSFIMMDEPFAALDYFTRKQMQEELIKLQIKQNMSILFVTHSIDEALLIGHKIVIVEDGGIKDEFELDKDCNKRDLLDKEYIELKKKIIGKLNI